METLSPQSEEILFISDELSLNPRAARRRVIALWVLGLIVVVPMSLIMARATYDAVQKSRRHQCSARLQRIGVAFHRYEEVHGHLPAPALWRDGGTPLLSWRVELLPYLGYQSLYDRFHRDEPWDSRHNRALLAEMPWEFACPGGPGQQSGQTGYVVIVGPKTEFGSVNTPFEPTRGAEIREIIDGTSNSILVFETRASVPWTKPDDFAWSPDRPLPALAGPHDGGTHVVFADGSARFLTLATSPQNLAGFFTINGNEVLCAG
jgi:prepilin-type processing-associated H-X9-DG protein